MSIRVCLGCGNTFDSSIRSVGTVRDSGNVRLFCKTSCRDRLYRQRYAKQRICEQCGKAFKSYAKRRFCGYACSAQTRRKSHGVIVSCAQCGKGFERRGGLPIGQSKRYNKFCSRECAFQSRRPPVGRGLADGYLRVLLQWVRVLTREQRLEAQREKARERQRERERQRRPPTWQCRQCQGVFKTVDRLRCICSRCLAINKKAAKKTSKAIRRARRKSVICEKVSPDAIFERDGWRCQHCQCRVSKRLGVNHDRYPNLDHVIPLSRGGPHTEENLQCLCRACNLDKSDQQLNLF